MEAVAFYILGFLAVVSSLFLITRENPVHSALWMLLTFFCVAGIFVQLNAEYIAAIQVLVYAGAILVLYLFVVLLLNPSTRGLMRVPVRMVLGSLVSIVVFIQIIMTLNAGGFPTHNGWLTPEIMEQYGNVKLFGQELFLGYLVPFEIASILLLVAMIGAIVLAKKD